MRICGLFFEVADDGGVSAAALRLGVSKSMVNRQLVRLEKQLGVQLLVRTTRGAYLTGAGSTFRDYPARACSEIEVAKETPLPKGELCGRLRIAALLSFGPTHLAPVIAETARCHPLLQIQTCYSDQVIDLIAEGYDYAMRVGYLQESNLIARRVGLLCDKLVASPDYDEKHSSPEKPEDPHAIRLSCSVRRPGLFLDAEKIVNVNPPGRFKANNAAALAGAAAAELEIAYPPDGITDEYIASGTLLPPIPSHPPPPAGIYVVRPYSQYPARKVRLLTEMLIEDFGPEAAIEG